MSLIKLRVSNPILFIVLAVIGLALNLALVVAFLWIAWHFISKWW